MDGNGWEWTEMGGNDREWMEMDGNGWEWTGMNGNGRKCPISFSPLGYRLSYLFTCTCFVNVRKSVYVSSFFSLHTLITGNDRYVDDKKKALRAGSSI